MKDKIWVLVTGTIRNELYLRITLIKLCDLWAKGLIEGIVFSTWKGEIDKYSDLRSSLKSLHIVLVETPYIKEDLERNFNEIAFERQRLTWAKGLESIPADAYVMKVRTDFYRGIGSFEKWLNVDDVSRRVNKFGEFPLVFNHKITMQMRGFDFIFKSNDRFFLLHREDMSKICLPLSYKRMSKFGPFIEDIMMVGYVYHFYPIFLHAWNIIPMNYYAELFKFCRSHPEEDLVLPRIIHRIFATACVFLYTQVNNLLGDDCKVDDAPIQLIDLYRGKIRSNKQIQKIVNGNFRESHIAEAFRIELRNIENNIEEARTYTYEEYKELVSFTEEKLGRKNWLGNYSFADILKVESNNCENAVKILLGKYNNEIFERKIQSLINENYSSFGISVYSKMRPFEKMDDALRLEMIKAGVFDCEFDAILAYGMELLNNPKSYDNTTWTQGARYLKFFFVGTIKADFITAVYYYVKSYENLRLIHNEMMSGMTKFRFMDLLDYMLQRILSGHKKLSAEISSNDFLHLIISGLYERLVPKKLSDVCLILIESLLQIKPSMNPFSPSLITMLRKNGYVALADRIESNYKNNEYIEGGWFESNKVKDLLAKKNINAILMYASEINGQKDADAVVRYYLNTFWGYSNSVKDDISNSISRLSKLYIEPNILIKMGNFIRTNQVQITRDDVKDICDFVLLLEILYRKNFLLQNENTLLEMCLGESQKIMFLSAFIRIAKDERLDFFSTKNKGELWLYYVPYLSHHVARELIVPHSDKGWWPWADRDNESAFAGFISLSNQGVLVSIEFTATDKSRARKIAIRSGFKPEESSAFMRLKRTTIPYVGQDNIKEAVGKALDEFCLIGEKIVASLE